MKDARGESALVREREIGVQKERGPQRLGQPPPQDRALGGQAPDGQRSGQRSGQLFAQKVTFRAASRVLARSSSLWAKLSMAHSKPEGAR
ncbi:hypothetical protein JCM14635_07490 [Megalodesulfovibrio paquesii]